MKHLNYKIFALLVGLLICSATGSFAQFPGMKAVYARIEMQQQMNMQMMMMGNLNSVDYNVSHSFTVTFKDSSKKIVKSKFYRDTVTKKNYLLFVDKTYPKSDSNRNKRIYPSQTINISLDIPVAYASDHPTGSVLKYTPFNGMPSDSCWMFKVVSGPIRAYSYLAEPPVYAVPETIIAIQFNDGSIVECNAENLKKMVGQDIDAINQINKKNFYKAIKKYNRNREKLAKK